MTISEFFELQTELSFSANRTIVDPDLPSAALYMVKSGSVKLYVVSSEGKRFDLAVLKRGDIFGLKMDGPNVIVEAKEDCALYVAQYNNVVAQYAQELLKIARRRLQTVINTFTESKTVSVEVRVARFLLEQSELQGGRSFLTGFFQEDIARRLGVSRVWVSQTIGKFTDRGIVQVLGKGKLEILDFDALFELDENGG